MDNLFSNKRICPPLLILGMAIAFSIWHEQLPAETTAILQWLPYALSFIIAGLALQFNRRQLLLVVLINGFGYGLVSHYLQQPLHEPQAFTAFTLLSLFLPVNLWLNLCFKEQGLHHYSTWLLGGLLIVQGLMIVTLSESPSGATVELLSQWFATRPIDGIIISSNALGLSLVLSMLAFFWLLYRPSTIGIGLFFALIAAIVPIIWLDQPFISATFFSAAMIIALISGFSDSHELAYQDQLTGLPGRRRLMEKLKPLRRNYCLAMVDIDHFKQFNDTYGHDVGDDVLAMVAARLADVGGNGQVFRYGGEEFTVLFKGKETDSFYQHLDELRESIAETPFTLRDQAQREQSDKSARNRKAQHQKSVQVTVSIGAAQKSQGHDSHEEVLKSADEALYQAKEQGRNQVVLAQE